METIFALSTPPGKSGVAVIRISGKGTLEVLRALGMMSLPPARMATLVALQGANKTVIDKAIIIYFPAPHSFTGEDVVELHTHGSRAVIKELFDHFAALPFMRTAEPGEFTRRAFLNGKMDLTAAEGLIDLIEAETEAQRKQALRHMQGDAARFYEKLRADILHALAFLEAYIDFPDEDIPEDTDKEINEEIQNIIKNISHQLATSKGAEKIRDGIHIAILGPPNAGKSSLMNLLAGRDVAIVSHVAGTTRDVIETHLDIGGYCVILSDTAGIREYADEIEKEGIHRSFDRADKADIRIVVIEGGTVITEELKGLILPNTLLLLNKIDQAIPALPPSILDVPALPISVKKREGIDELIEKLKEYITSIEPGEGSFVTQARHKKHLSGALSHLEQYVEKNEAGIELRSEELRRAAVEIGKITGAIAVDELLGHIFSSFCIGK